MSEDKINKSQKKINTASAIANYFQESRYPTLVRIGTLLNTIMFGVALLIYVTLGCIMHNWGKTWMVFIFSPVIPSVLTAIGKGRFCAFLMPFLALGIYLAIGMNMANGWHPYWIIMLSIPLYYGIFVPVDKYLNKINSKKDQ